MPAINKDCKYPNGCVVDPRINKIFNVNHGVPHFKANILP